MTRRQLGTRGEDWAAAYLQARGVQIVARNWRPHGAGLRGEIDLIAQEGPTLLFVEVRTRRGAAPGGAAESVTPVKAAQLVALALAYLQTHHPDPDRADWRIDVVAIGLPPVGAPLIEWLRGAVEGG